MSSRRSVDGSTTERPGDVRLAFPCQDHAPGVNKLFGIEFQRTAHMKPAPTRRRHTRFRPFRDHAALEFRDSANHREHHAARRRVRVDSVHDRLKSDIPASQLIEELKQVER